MEGNNSPTPTTPPYMIPLIDTYFDTCLPCWPLRGTQQECSWNLLESPRASWNLLYYHRILEFTTKCLLTAQIIAIMLKALPYQEIMSLACIPGDKQTRESTNTPRTRHRYINAGWVPPCVTNMPGLHRRCHLWQGAEHSDSPASCNIGLRN